nr:MAG TPA: hypothetical protein [Bacteriophage sp.]
MVVFHDRMFHPTSSFYIFFSLLQRDCCQITCVYH